MSRIPNEYRVERAGNFTLGYGLGWFARHEPTETGAWFPTWREAYQWADGDARRRLDEAHESRSRRRTASNVVGPHRTRSEPLETLLAPHGPAHLERR